MTQEDIDKIAKAVWSYMLNDPSVNKLIKAGDLLSYTRGAAANADYTTPQEVWAYKTRTLTE